jgi:hypothetical protein
VAVQPPCSISPARVDEEIRTDLPEDRVGAAGLHVAPEKGPPDWDSGFGDLDGPAISETEKPVREDGTTAGHAVFEGSTSKGMDQRSQMWTVFRAARRICSRVPPEGRGERRRENHDGSGVRNLDEGVVVGRAGSSLCGTLSS